MDPLSVVVLLCSALLVILGGLLGHSLSQWLMARDIRRQAEVTRQIGEQWREIQVERARRAQHRCPRCGALRGTDGRES